MPRHSMKSIHNLKTIPLSISMGKFRYSSTQPGAWWKAKGKVFHDGYWIASCTIRRRPLASIPGVFSYWVEFRADGSKWSGYFRTYDATEYGIFNAKRLKNNRKQPTYIGFNYTKFLNN